MTRSAATVGVQTSAKASVLSTEWSYLRPGQASYCACLVDGLGRQHQDRHDRARRRGDDRRDRRRCRWFLVAAGGRVAVRLRLVPARRPPADDTPSTMRCRCGALYELKEIPIVRSAEAAR